MYEDLSLEDAIILTVKFIAAGTAIPTKLKELVGDDLLAELMNPERYSDATTENPG